MKRTVTEKIISSLDLDGMTISHAISYLESLSRSNSDKQNLRIGWQQEPWEDTYRYYLIYDRPETQEEEASRISEEKRSEAWEKSNYERLKKKFEK